MVLFRCHLICSFLFLCTIGIGFAANNDGVIGTLHKPVKIKNGSVLTFNLTFTDQEPVQKVFIELQPKATITLTTNTVPTKFSFLLFQVHCYTNKMMMSYTYPPRIDEFTVGHHTGLVYELNAAETSGRVSLHNPTRNVITALVGVNAYVNSAPVPGGCNQEFSVAISPFLKVNNTGSTTSVSFQLASGTNPTGGVDVDCDMNTLTGTFDYTMYYKYLPTGDLTKETFYAYIQKMWSWSEAQKFAREYGSENDNSLLAPRVYLGAYPGIGVAFVVTVKDYRSYLTATYIPTLTYACNPNDEVSCHAVTSSFGWVLCAFGAFSGFFLALFGHRVFCSQLFLIGFSISSMIAFIVFKRFVIISTEGIVSATMVVGAGGGLLWLLFWSFTGVPILSVLPSGLLCGFLLSLTALYTPLISLDFFRSDPQYWMIVAICSLAFTTILLCFTKLLSILSCSVIGAYGFTVAVDRYIGGTLAYIVLNGVRRGFDPEFRLVSLPPPFHFSDSMLCICWVTVTLLGLTFQHFTEKRRPPFPPPPRLCRCCITYPVARTHSPEEYEPLLGQHTTSGSSPWTAWLGRSTNVASAPPLPNDPAEDGRRHPPVVYYDDFPRRPQNLPPNELSPDSEFIRQHRNYGTTITIGR